MMDGVEFEAAGRRERQPTFWTDEDGERYFCEAHMDIETMRAKALAFEAECAGRELVDEDVLRAIGEMTALWQGWLCWDPNDDEAPGQIVEKGTPGAVPQTMLS